MKISDLIDYLGQLDPEATVILSVEDHGSEPTQPYIELGHLDYSEDVEEGELSA